MTKEKMTKDVMEALGKVRKRTETAKAPEEAEIKEKEKALDGTERSWEARRPMEFFTRTLKNPPPPVVHLKWKTLSMQTGLGRRKRNGRKRAKERKDHIPVWIRIDDKDRGRKRNTKKTTTNYEEKERYVTAGRAKRREARSWIRARKRWCC